MIRTKQPTIEDIYAFDNFISTPGVRQGLLERAGDGDPELTIEDTDDGQVVYYNAPHGEQVAVGRPIMLAMGGNAAGRNSDRPISDVPTALFDMGAGVARGAVAQTLGLPGDMQKIYNGLKSVFNRPEDQPRLDAFLKGMEQPTSLPTTERMGEILPPVVPAGAPDAQRRQGSANYGQAFGELAPLPGALDAAAVGVKAGAKALAPKAGEMIINSMDKLGSPVRMNAVPDSPAGAVKATAPVSDTGFYSAVEQAALNIQRKSGSGQAMLNDITKGENVKADEIKWIGLDDFLKGKKNVTREEVQQYIAANKVDIQEVTLGEEGGQKGREIAAQDMREVMEAGGTFDDDAQYALQRWLESDPNSRVAKSQEALLEEKLSDAGDRRFVSEFVDSGSAQTDATRYGAYTLPGGENYREILLTLPSKEAAPTRETFNIYNAEGNMVSQGMWPPSERAQQTLAANPGYRLERGSIETARPNDYTSSHWDQENVLAHIRVNDRVDADGKKMLLVEEVQSDWHQAGRDKGYIGNYAKEDVKPYTPEQAKAEFGLDNADLFWYFKVPDNTFQIPKSRFATQDEALNYVLAEKKVNQYGVPDAPMKDTWYQLALKRVLKYAADNGYDRIGLTTGSRQAERYNLSEQIDALTWIPKGDGTYDFEVLKDGATTLSKRDADAKWLKDAVGKELAQKIINDQHTDILERSGRRFIEGNDLRVGGEGMKTYYDEVYPQFLAKYGKKWGAKVGETRINAADAGEDMFEVVLPNGKVIASRPNRQQAEATASSFDGAVVRAIDHGEPVRFVDITPEMRQGVGKGQPLFSAAGAGAGATGATIGDKEQK